MRIERGALWERVRHPFGTTALAALSGGRVFASLKHKNFARLCVANIGATTAYTMQTVAVGWLVIELTDSPFMLGLLSFFRFVPMLLIAPIGGVLADRFDRVRLVVLAQSLLATAALAIGLLVMVGWIDIWHLILASLVVGASFSINIPARHAMMADLVPRKDVANAVGLNNVTWSSTSVIGPPIAGFLISVIGIASAYFAQIVGYVWSIVMLRRITVNRSQRLVQGSMLTSLRDGFSYVLHHKPVLTLMILTLALAIFGMPMIMLLPAFVKQDLAGGPTELGLLMGALGGGSLLGAILVVTFSRFPYKGRVALGAVLLYGVLLIGLGFSRSFSVSGVLLALIGFCEATYIAASLTIVQLTVPTEVRGRVVSIWMASWGLMAIGLLPMSALAERLGTPLAMSIGGTLTSIVVIALIGWGRRLWYLQPDSEHNSHEPIPAAE